MKKRVWSIYDKMILLLMGLFSFISCKEESDEPIICMYGVPATHFIVKGNVTDSLTNTPIGNIRVTASQPYRVEEKIYYNTDTVSTDASGNYTIVLLGDRTSFMTNPVEVKTEDIDGANNGGLFFTQTASLVVSKDDPLDESKYGVTKTKDFKLLK